MSDWYLQQEYGVRFEWGAGGAERVAGGVGCLVVVDVLSFSTSVNVAVEAGTRVHPYAWRDETASVFARDNAAELAVGRRVVTAASPWSLSPPRSGGPRSPRLVLPRPTDPPSPRRRAARPWSRAVCATRRPSADGWRSMVTEPWNGPRRDRRGRALAGRQPAAGSGGPDGAGAVIAALQAAGGAGPLSPEAAAARTAFTGTPTRPVPWPRVPRSGAGPERLRRLTWRSRSRWTQVRPCPCSPTAPSARAPAPTAAPRRRCPHRPRPPHATRLTCRHPADLPSPGVRVPLFPFHRRSACAAQSPHRVRTAAHVTTQSRSPT